MDKEKIKQTLRDEGFPIVYEWADEPNTKYDKHVHEDKVCFYLIRGEVAFDFAGEEKVVKAGERFDVPPKTEHKAIVGSEGAEYVVGAMREGDS